MLKFLKKLSSVTVVISLLLLVASPALAVEEVVATNLEANLTSPVTTLIITGTMEQLVVNAGNVVITMSNGAFPITITNTHRYRFTVSGITDPGTSCTSPSSTLILPAQGSTPVVTITPSTLCGGGGGGSTPPPSEPITAPETTTGSVTADATLGGSTTVTTSDGNTAGVDIPASSINVDTAIVVTPVAITDSAVLTAVAAIPTGKSVVGANVYNYTATVGGSPVTAFLGNVTLSFTYTDAQVVGLALSSLEVYYYDVSNAAWMALPTTVNTSTKTITTTTNHLTYFAIFGSVDEGDTPVDEVALIDSNGDALVDGDLISTQDSYDIYIASFVGDKRFKRLILNPAIFESYGHLEWGNVRTVSQAVQDEFTLSDLVIEVNDDGSVADEKVYKVTSALDADVGQRQWLNMTAAQFEAEGYDWDALAKINHTEASVDFYPIGLEITSAL